MPKCARCRFREAETDGPGRGGKGGVGVPVGGWERMRVCRLDSLEWLDGLIGRSWLVGLL